MQDTLSFLQSIQGFTASGGDGNSANRPILLGTIDPAYVKSTYPGTLPKVTFDGESLLSGKQYAVLSGYRPAPGDRVVLVPVGTTYMILGAVGAAGGYFTTLDAASNLTVAGSASVAGAFAPASLAVTGNATVGGTATVTGLLTASSNLTVSGSATVAGAVAVASTGVTVTGEAWTSLTLGSGWSGTLRYRLVAGPARGIWLIGNMTPGTKTDGTTIATLPVGYRPATGQDIYATGFGGTLATTQNPHFNVVAAGSIQVYGIGTSSGCNLNGFVSLDF